jgi:hypothetical protein
MKSPKISKGFVYLWRDTKNKYYLGSHLGELDDGYTGSNNRFQCAYKSRPLSFKRKILEYYPAITSRELLAREQLWLSQIKAEELHGIKYYNEKNVASGGDIVSTLTTEGKKQHAEKSGIASKKYWDNISDEDYQKRKETSFGGNTFSRDYMQLDSYRETMSITKKGLKIGFCGKKWTIEEREIIGERNRLIKPASKTYKITLIDGTIDIIKGMIAIEEKYCKDIKIKFSRFINKNIPIKSNRKTAINSLLYGATIEIITV